MEFVRPTKYQPTSPVIESIIGESIKAAQRANACHGAVCRKQEEDAVRIANIKLLMTHMAGWERDLKFKQKGRVMKNIGQQLSLMHLKGNYSIAYGWLRKEGGLSFIELARVTA